MERLLFEPKTKLKSSETLGIGVSGNEKHYKNLAYPNVEYIKNEKLFCTVCSEKIRSEKYTECNFYIHPILDVILFEGCLRFYKKQNVVLINSKEKNYEYCIWCLVSLITLV